MSKWFNITNSAAGSAVIDIFDEIGAWGISAKDFVNQLRLATGNNLTSLTLNIDSPGGSVDDGLTIYDAIKALGVPVTSNVTGTAASMASVIMLAADKITIAENGRVMIHRVSGGVMGNPDDVAAAAAVMKQFEDRIINIYMARTGKDETTIRDLMKAEIGTWFFGQEAVDAGFADEVTPGVQAKAFQPNWAKNFTALPVALFDMPTNPKPTAHSPKNMKALIALASLVGLSLKGDETEDQLCDAIAAHKPTPPKMELNVEDPETKAHFQKLVDEATASLKTEVTNLTALIKNGAAGAAGAGAPVTAGAPAAEAPTMSRTAFNKLSHAERNAFMATNGKLSND
jgi:ATP-dependent Clp endopeptidase proteolytic subunit ClpP